MRFKDSILYTMAKDKSLSLVRGYVQKHEGNINKILEDCYADKTLREVGYTKDLIKVLVAGALEELGYIK